MLASLSLWAVLAGGNPAHQTPGQLQLQRAPDSDSALAALAHGNPDELREMLRRLLISAAFDSTPDAPLAAARRLATAYSVAWRDTFLLSRVELFSSWTRSQRQVSVAADSLRRAGNDALGRLGVAAALHDWRESLLRATTLEDSAGMAAALGNIGAGFYIGGKLDSSATYLGRARDLARRIGDYRTLGNAIGTLARVNEQRGDLRSASKLYAQASVIRPRTGDERGAAADRNNAGLTAQGLGDMARARQAFEAALASNRRDGRDEPAAVNLVNLGNIASLSGEYALADARYRDALALYRAHDSRVNAASVRRRLGLLDLDRGEYGAALAELVAALATYRATGPSAEVIAIRRDIAAVHAAMGNLEGALVQLGVAERLAGAGGMPPRSLANLAIARADLAVRFNTFEEADRQYARAERLYARASDTTGMAAAEQGHGLLLLLRENYSGAQRVLERALAAQLISGDSRSAALTRLQVGYAQLHRGDTAGARHSLSRAIDTLRRLGDAVGAATAYGALGGLEAQAGASFAAESLYRRGLERLGARAAPDAAWQLHSGLGDLLYKRGALPQARLQLAAAVAEVERVSGRLPLGERRASYLADKWDVYARLAMVEKVSGRAEAAFAASERMRAREMLDLLAFGRVTQVAPADVGHALVSREQDLRRRITRLTRQLETGPADVSGLRGPAAGSGSGAGRVALVRAQEEYTNLLRQMRDAGSPYASLVSGEVATARDVMRRLAPTEALIEYLVSDSTTLAFVVTPDTVVAIDLHVNRRALVGLVDLARGTLVRPGPGPDRALWRAPLRRLHQSLFEPLESSGVLAGKRALFIAPHAELHYVPFAALTNGAARDQYLIERYRLTYVPSASVWLRLPAGATQIGEHVLALAPRVDALPGSREEVAAIARIYGGRARVLIGAAATERALRDTAPSQSIVHFATYGSLNKENPMFSFVELMPQGDDNGRLEVHDVFGLSLRARLVVLSACQTALGAGALADVPAGDDWVGLVDAFLVAGASHVMATLWPIEDRTTARFTERFYGQLERGRSEAEALADAQRQTLRNPGTSHPFYWAGFTVSGGR
jgi:CHAT domain-containing protein/tetratricopeptide (TPR) repeat protein